MSSQLRLDVFVAPYKPIVAQVAPMGEGEATWPATSVSLISGERDAVLVDALIIFEEAGRVVDWIRESGKNLTTIYITHGHGDHFFGLNTILAAFPDARAVTAAGSSPLRRDRSVLRGWASGARCSPVRFPSSRSCRGPSTATRSIWRTRSCASLRSSRPIPRHRRWSTSRAWMPSSRVMWSTTASTHGWQRPTMRAGHGGSRASSRSRRSSRGSPSPATSARTRATTTRPQSSAPRRPTSSTSSSRWPRAARHRSWSTR